MDKARVIFNVNQNSDISKNLVDFRYQFLIEKVVNKNTSIALDYSDFSIVFTAFLA